MIADVLRLFANIAAGMPAPWAFRYGTTFTANAPNNDNWPCLFLEFPMFITYGVNGLKTYDVNVSTLTRYSGQDNPHRARVEQMTVCQQAAEHVLAKLRALESCADTTLSLQGDADAITVGDVNNDVVVGLRLELKLSSQAMCEPYPEKPGAAPLCDYATFDLTTLP